MTGALERRAGLAGRSAVVAGGAGGLGRGIATAFAEAGLRVSVCDSDADALRSVAPLVEHTAQLDVRDDSALDGYFEALAEHGITPDVLVDVVGGTFQAPFLATRPKGWRMLAELNFDHVLALTHRAASRMREHGTGGSIILISSIEAHRAAPGYAIYAAMKSAVEGFGRSLAVELGPDGIRVNSIAPDYVPTAGVSLLERSQGRPAIDDREAAGIVPLGRLGTVDDVAGAALFLASDLASFVTGSSVHPDGGALAAGRWARDGEEWIPRLPRVTPDHR